MQVIQIRYLKATDHHGARIKAFGEVWYGEKRSITESVDFAQDTHDQAKKLAARFCTEWYQGMIVSGFGELPGNDSDWVATVKNRRFDDQGNERPMYLHGTFAKDV